ncbi:MAG: helix-turn-helix domain-containing protein, partial [Chromatiales bacterium]|nr:helix-turn-helix domain-containing protein [Chromatiales bacterium]
NVRELEQVIRRVLLSQRIEPQQLVVDEERAVSDSSTMQYEKLTAKELLTRYCGQLFQCYGTYEAVARHSGLDRRTVKKYIEAGLA